VALETVNQGKGARGAANQKITLGSGRGGHGGGSGGER
jgi:hypothetical protein